MDEINQKILDEMIPEVSILVPVYKVEKYLKRFLDSVLKQDFQNWEMILVDDGSPDACPQICDSYASKDSRITVVHKENGGLVSARKAGFEKAKGKYLVFWDSDDVVPPTALSVLYSHIIKGYDVVRGQAKRLVEGQGICDLERYAFTEGEISSTEEYLVKQIDISIPCYLWLGMYKKELFNSTLYDLLLKYNIGVCEDWLANILVGSKVKRALFISDIVYYYYTNPTSMMQSSVCSEQYRGRIDDLLGEAGILSIPAVGGDYKEKRICSSIYLFFVPEFSFSWSLYKKVGRLMHTEKYKVLIKKGTDKKFLRFINCPILYFIYSRLYCCLFKYLKLKGKTRKIIK